jgi:type VI protein secretion system component Hcp
VVTGPRQYSRAVGNVVVGDLVLFIHGLTAASSFALAVATGKPVKLAEIELTTVQGGNEQRYMLIRMQDIIITSVSRTPPPNQQISTQGQRVEIDYDKINWTYFPVSSQPIPSELLRLRRT